MTLALFQSLLGIESERSFIRFMLRFFSGYFPLLDQSQYNRRMKDVRRKLELFRRKVLLKLDPQTDLFVIDSMPVPVMNPVRWRFSGSFPELSVGHCASLKHRYYGGKLHLLITHSGIPIRFDFTPANVDDRSMLVELLEDCGFITVVGDKGYIDQQIKEDMKIKQNITLITPYRKNQKKKMPEAAKTPYLKTRKRVESIFNQFADHFKMKSCLARTVLGLTTRILQKITAFSLGMYLNKIFGRKRLAIKSLLA